MMETLHPSLWTESAIAVVLFLLFVQILSQRRPPKFPPGPTGVPILGYIPFLKFPAHIGMLEICKKYGKIASVFFGSYPIVLISDFELIRDALRDERLTGRIPIRATKARSFGATRGIIFADGKLWSEQRRFVLKNLRDFGFGKGSMEALIKEDAHELVDYLKSEVNYPICIQPRINAALLNTLWYVISGQRSKHDDPKLPKMLKMLVEQFEENQIMGPIFFFPWLTYIFPEWTGWNKLMGTLTAAYDLFATHIKEHKEKLDPDYPNDLIDMYLNEISATRNPNSSFYNSEGDKNLLVVLLDLFAAGGDSSSTILAYAILYLITYPEIQKKAQLEIDEHVGNERLPCLSDRHNLPYIEAIIAETLRISSITPLGGIRSPTEPVDFHGYILPKDTVIIPNIWAVHHNSEYWGDPENFRPERFIGPNGKFQKNERLIPFSTGKRVCIGEGLARDELFLYLTTMLHQLEFNINPDEPPPTLEPKQSMVLHPVPYKVVMQLRQAK